LVALLACTSTKPTPQAKPNTDDPAPRKEQEPSPDPRDLAEVPSPVPSGNIIASYACSHSEQPWGTGWWQESTTVDLARGEWSWVKTEGNDATADAPPDQAEGPKSETDERPLDAASAARVAKALQEVLDGGPYPRIYPPSEGISCALTLRVGDAEPFFTVERAEPGKPDEVTALIAAIHGG
jgi:hypothetical protein